MEPKTGALRNLISVDEPHLDYLIDQLPRTVSILENVKANFGFSIGPIRLQFQSETAKNKSVVKKVRQLESHLDRNGLINHNRPRRMPHGLNGHQFWWVRESFVARKVILPTPTLADKFGIVALTIWISDPKRTAKPTHEMDWTGSFLYLPTIHYDRGITANVVSGCSALQFIVNAAENKPLYDRNELEPFGRGNGRHPIEKLSQLGAFVSDKRRLESLYYVRYITDEQVFSPNGSRIRVNDVVGYPIYIAAYPSAVRRQPEILRIGKRKDKLAGGNFFFG